MRLNRLAILGCALALGACSVMDDAPYKRLAPVEGGSGGSGGTGGDSDAGGMGGSGGSGGDSGAGGAGGTGGAGGSGGSGQDAGPPHLVDTCSRSADRQNMYVLQSSNDYYEVSTEGFADDISASAGSCTPHATPGIDGFAAVDVQQAGERWHFHVRARNGANPPVQNPVVYMLNSCDVRSCMQSRSLDLCGDRQDEHFTFEAPMPGRWFLGIDDRNPGAGGEYEMLVIRTQCGNNVSGEHNEACDDGNFDPGDGCDPECRREIPEVNNIEEEFNDDWTTANALLFRGGSNKVSVKGRVGMECSFDMFTFVIPQSGGTRDVRIIARDRSSTSASPTCVPAGISGVELFLWGSDGHSPRNAEPAALGVGGCPELEPGTNSAAQGLAPGRYFVSLKGDETATLPFNYELEVELR